jgi:hypothetical protein
MNARNAVSVAIAAQHFGVTPNVAASALSGFAGISGRMNRVPSTQDLDVYIDSYGYLPESLAENRSSVSDMHPQRRHVLVFSFLSSMKFRKLKSRSKPSSADGIRSWTSYQSLGLLRAAGNSCLIGLETALRGNGVDVTFIGPLENGLTVLPDLLEVGDAFSFACIPSQRISLANGSSYWCS